MMLYVDCTPFIPHKIEDLMCMFDIRFNMPTLRKGTSRLKVKIAPDAQKTPSISALAPNTHVYGFIPDEAEPRKGIH